MRSSIAFTLVAAALLALSGCTRYLADPEVPGKVHAGRLVRLVPRTPPEGEAISWDPGDGSPPRVGPELAHAFQRPGRYVVRASSSGGVTELPIEVIPRPPIDVVPANAGSAVLFPRGFTGLAAIEAFIDRILPDPALREELEKAKQRAGVDPSSPDSLEDAGLDPEEGFGFLSPADDPDATWFFAGTLDDERALALAVRITEAPSPGPAIEAGLGRLWGLPGKEGPVPFALGGGYLFTRISGPPRDDLAPVVANLLAQASGTITADADFARATAEAPGTDVVFFARTDKLAVPGAQTTVPVIAAGLDLKEDELTARLFAPLPPDVQAAVARAAGGTGPAALLERLPGGALGFLAFSARPAAVLQELVPDPDQRLLFDQSLLARFGTTASELAALLTGDMVVALYPDPASLGRAIQSGGRALEEDPPPMISLAGLRGGAPTQKALEALLLRAGGRPEAKGAVTLGPVKLRIVKDVLEAATGSAREKLGQKGDGRLLAVLREAGLTRSDELVAFLDLAGVHDLLVATPPPRNATDAERQAYADRVKGAAAIGALRDLTLGLHPAPGGVGASLRLRLRPR